MKITSLSGGMGRDLYGIIQCEHCGGTDDLKGGYDDTHWHHNVLPAMHCGSCGRNRAGERPSPEVTARNKANGVNGI